MPNRSRLLAWAGALALAFNLGCSQEPAPFDPIGDCPKIAYCGQCASRGACAWCGDAADPAKGQCVAVGHAECKAITNTPDRCAAPPAATAAASASTQDESPQQKSVREALQRAFPQGKVTRDVVDAVVQLVLQRQGNRREQAPIARRVAAKDHKLYLGEADHHRVKSAPPAAEPLQSQFTMALPMVRVPLPEKLDGSNAKLTTEIGDVDFQNDHLLGSIDQIAAKYAAPAYLGYRPARVDLITPARAANSRFGAIAVYLGYRNKADKAPSFYMLEAGTANGDAKMIYFSPSMAEIGSVTSYYLPTPFVTMSNTYSGGVTMAKAPDEDEPDLLIVRSHAGGDKDPYITVTVKYRRVKELDVPIPYELTADAGARVALIAKTMGIANAVDLQKLLEDLGRNLLWTQSPHYVRPAH